MFKIIASGILGFTVAMCAYGFAAPANAACDKAKAQEMVALIEDAYADRVNDPELTFVKYEWRGNWDALTDGQKRRLARGIGAVEKCLTGKQVKIRYAGEDVAYFSPSEEVEIYH